MKDVTDMARTRGRKLATMGATALAAASVAVAGCATGQTSVTPAAAPAPTATAAATGPASMTAVTIPLAPPAYTPPARALAPGMTGADVKALQRRLSELKYYPGATDGQFGPNTQAALWAFQEINGIRVTGVADAATKRALVHPSAYQSPSYPGKRATRIEVNQALEVLVLFDNNKVALISHVSSGGGYYYNCGSGSCSRAVTPNGTYNTRVFMPGWVTVPLGEMYNPVFFIGTAYAIHGDTYVPAGPASHGCVRVPMDIADFFHTLVKSPGTQVHIYGTPQWER